MNTEQQIHQQLNQQLNVTYIAITNDSHRHQGHAGWNQGGDTHFSITIVSPDFEKLSRIQRHQRIYAILEEWMKKTIHALQIFAYSLS